jgi:hypothetical protein
VQYLPKPAHANFEDAIAAALQAGQKPQRRLAEWYTVLALHLHTLSGDLPYPLGEVDFSPSAPVTSPALVVVKITNSSA